jgi:hypothetical protein
MDAIRGSNRFGPSGTPDALIDDPRTEGDVWADVQAADLVPFPVDPPGGWQHGQDGFDAGFDAAHAGLGDGIDFNAGSLQLADGVDLASDIAAFDGDRGGPAAIDSTFAGLDTISTADPSDGMDSLGDDLVEDVQIGAANWGLEFLTLDGEDTPPIAPLDAAGDLTWADLAPDVERFDGVDDPDLDLDAPLVRTDLANFDDFVQLDGEQGDDFVGAPLPMFVLDPLSSLQLDQVDALSPMAQDTAAPRFLSEDDVFGDQYDPDLD